MAEVKRLNVSSYDDGYYWDYRVVFEYKDRKFVLIKCGSTLGDFPVHEEIAYAGNELLKDWNPLFGVEVDFDDEELIEDAEVLLASGEDSYVLEDQGDW